MDDAQRGEKSHSLGLDLVRATAILLVLLAHWSNNISFWFGRTADVRLAFSGELGVSLFFALSGFLIGQILIDAASRAPRWANLEVFLIRRWMRTLPVYFAWLVVLLLFLPPPERSLEYALRYATMTQNVVTPLPPGWWFAVSWSLVIEEWFYIFFGAATFLAFRAIRAGWAIWVPIGVFLVAPTAARFLVPGFSDPANPLILVALLRIDAIAYGVAAAALYRQGSRAFDHPWLLGGVGAALIAALGLGGLLNEAFQSPLAPLHYNLVMIGCVLLLPLALKLKRAPTWLAWPIRKVSAISYGLYVIHLTLLEHVAQPLFLSHRVSVWGAVAIAIVSPFVLAWLSFRYFETPILRRRPPQTRDAPLPGGAGLAPATAG